MCVASGACGSNHIHRKKATGKENTIVNLSVLSVEQELVKRWSSPFSRDNVDASMGKSFSVGRGERG